MRSKFYTHVPLSNEYGLLTRRSSITKCFQPIAFCCFLFLSVFMSLASHAQECFKCSASDVNVVSVKLFTTTLNANYNATLPDGPGNYKYTELPATCTGTSAIQGYIRIEISQNATDRYGFKVTGDVYIDNSPSGSIDYCDGRTFSKTDGDAILYLTDDQVNWTCGTRLEIRNLFTAWGIQSDKNICDVSCTELSQSGNYPHCRQFSVDESFIVITPLSADFTYTTSCTGSNSVQTVSFDAGATTGGTSPYVSYEWDLNNDGQFDDATGATPSYTFSSTGIHIVGLKVTDGDPTAVSTVYSSVNVGSCCTTPVIANQVPGAICSGGQVNLSSTDFTGSNTIPASTSFSWSAPTEPNIGGLGSGTDASSFSTGVLTNSTNSQITVVYSVTPKSGNCTGDAFTISVAVNPNPTVGVGDALDPICKGGTTPSLGGSFGGSATGAIWDDGEAGGSFANNDGSTPGNATYTAASNAPSSITLTLTTTGGTCGPEHLDKVLNIGANGTISLSSASGTDAQTPCVNSAITSITYAVGGSATSASLTGTLPNGVSGSFANGVFTISGTPTQSGTFNYTVTTTGSSCVNPHLDGSITVGGDGTISLSSASGTDAQTPCVNTAITSITYAVGGTATGASLTGTLPNGVSGSFANGVFTISGTPTQSGTFNYTVTTTGSSCVNPHLDGSITVGRNVLCSAYSGDYFANTGLTTSGGSATVTVAWSVSSAPNPPNVCNSMTGLSLTDFIVAPNADQNVNSVTLVAGSASYTNGIYSAKYTIGLKSIEYSGTVIFTLGTTSTSNYTISATCSDNPIVTVSSKSDGFVTGGGFIIPTNACGSLATPVNGVNPINGLKNNFGFNMKYNKAGKLQGNWNTIIRRNEGGKVVVYQVKSNVASTLIVTKIDDKRMRADLTYTSANFQNLTCSLCPVDANNGTVVVTVYDNGEPGAGVDSILISIRDRSNSQWYTSHAPGSHSSINSDVQLIKQGNIQIHTLGGSKTARIAAEQSVTEVQPFNLLAQPNPSASSFNLQLTSSNKIDKMNVRVTDITGRTVQVLHDLAPNQTLTIGSGYRPGLYMVELVQGNERKQIKLVKL
jgi:hypothetical protein